MIFLCVYQYTLFISTQPPPSHIPLLPLTSLSFPPNTPALLSYHMCVCVILYLTRDKILHYLSSFMTLVLTTLFFLETFLFFIVFLVFHIIHLSNQPSIQSSIHPSPSIYPSIHVSSYMCYI